MFKKYRFLIAAITLLHFGVNAQNLNTPYSRFGVGSISPSGVARNTGMAGIGQSTSNALFLNLNNPALLSRTNKTIFETGLSLQSGFLKTNSLSQNNSTINLGYLAYSFPVAKYWSSGFGLKPYSSVNYAVFQSSSLNDSTTANYQYEGQGGISQFFWSNGFNPIRGVYLGIEASYLFGKTESQSISYLESNNEAALYSNVFRERESYSGFKFKPGFALRKELTIHTDSVTSSIKIQNKAYREWLKNVTECIDSVSNASAGIKPFALPDSSKQYKPKQENKLKRAYTDDIKEKKESFCKNCYNEPAEYVKIKDTSVVGERFFGKGNHLKKLKANAIVGKFIIVLKGERDLIINPDLKNKRGIDKLEKLLDKNMPVGYGVYLKQFGDGLVILEELRSLVKAGEINNKANVKDLKNYINRKSGIFFNIGGSYELLTNIGVDVLSTNEIVKSDLAVLKLDTVSYDETSTLTLPSAFHFGFGLEKIGTNGVKNNGQKRTSVWNVGVEFSYYQWSKFRDYKNINNLNDSYRMAVGGEWSPKWGSSTSSSFGKAFYRLGLHYENTPYHLTNTNTGITTEIKDFGIDFGISIPTFRMSSFRPTEKFVTIGATLGQRGTMENNMIRENYVNVTLGLTLSDVWFQRAKFGL